MSESSQKTPRKSRESLTDHLLAWTLAEAFAGRDHWPWLALSRDAARLEERQAKARGRKSRKKTRKQCPRFNRAGGATVRVERGAAA
jgi:hypothetical protein